MSRDRSDRKRTRLLLAGVVAAGALGCASARTRPGGPVRVEALEERVEAGPLRVFVARVDLTDPRVDVRVTGPAEARPGDPTGTEAHLETVPDFRERTGAVVAVNANFFGKLDGAPARWEERQPVDVRGPSVSEGRVVSGAGDGGFPTLLLDAGRTARITCARDADLGGADDAVAGIADRTSGACLLVERGENRGAAASDGIAGRHPRTAAGLSRDGRELFLVVVDGRQPGWSVGATLEELGALLLRLGAWDAVNLDGGGSSSFVYEPRDAPAVRNRPSDGRFRPVANAIGVVLGPGR